MVSSNLLQCYISVQEMFCVLFFDYEMSPITRWGRKIGNCVRMAHESGLMRLFDGVFFFFFLVFSWSTPSSVLLCQAGPLLRCMASSTKGANVSQGEWAKLF